MTSRSLGAARQVGSRVAAVALGLLLAFLAAEIALRLAGVRPRRLPPPTCMVLEDDRFVPVHTTWAGGRIKRASPYQALGVDMGEYVPGAVFKNTYATNPRRYFDEDNAVTIRINSLGLRGPEVTAVKPEGKLRILALGDSFTLGVGLHEEDTFARRLEKMLNTRNPALRVQVLNAGVAGYNTRDEVVYLEHRWLALEPDLVMITFYLNDAYSDAAFLNRGQELGVTLPEPQGLARISRVWDLATHPYRVLRVRKAVEAYYKQQYFTRPRKALRRQGPMEMDWNESRAALARAVELTRERDIGLALVIFPELYKLDEGYPFERIHALVAAGARRLGIPVLDLLDTFKGRRASTLWVHPTDHHPNEIATALAAGAIRDFLIREGLVP